MKFSAMVLQRFVLASILVLTFGSCALKAKKDAGAPAESQLDQAVTAEASQAAPAVDISSSRILANPEQDPLGMELLDAAQGNQLIITAAPGSDYTVTRLSDPARLVIDIKGKFPHGMTRSYDLSDAELLSRIRVGSHPDKSRVVLDLVEDRPVEHKVDNRDDSIVVSLATTHANVDVMAAALPQADVPQAVIPAGDAAVEPAMLTDAAPEAILVNDESTQSLESTEVAPADEPAIVEEPAPLAAPESSELRALTIEQIAPGSNVLVAEVNNPGGYNFEKTAPSEYVLTLKNTRLASDVFPVVAQPESGLIRSARSISQNGDVLVRIFAQAGTRLDARSGPGKFVVAVKDGADMRAQPAPAEPPAEAKPAGDTPVVESKPGAEVKVSEAAGADLADDEIAALMPKKYRGRLISLDLQDTDIDNALRIIAEVSNLNIIASDDVTGKVTLRLIDVPWDQALDVILKTNGLDKVQEGNVIRIAPIDKLNQERQALKQLELSQAELEPLQVKYVRISYAKASELKPLVETVVSERGVVSYDERTNQLIIKDITAGIRNTLELVSRIDLRTPQVLLETQIVEANRNLLRDLGAELGFEFIASPATGNPTGMNFPNTVNLGGASTGTGAGPNDFSNFPAQAGSAGIEMLLGSADGSKSLDLRLTAFEQEGRARIISRPAVATTNNRPASIKSVEKIRIKTPQGGLSVATGQGASASGSSSVATETVEVGITLDVTPQASPDYYVLLDIKAKSSTFGSQLVDGIPSELERSANSTVLVSSGQTFALGGIYRITDNDSVTGVPFFKDIPVLGVLFRQSRVDNRDEELLFFITPRIIEGSFDDAVMKVSS